jgi:hypothetical protein
MVRSNLTMAVLLITAFVAGCAPTVKAPTSPSVPDGAASSFYPFPLPSPPPASGCVASQAQWALGQRATDDLLERARLSAAAAVARFVRHDEQITLEYLVGRLTLFLDSRSNVRSVVCS